MIRKLADKLFINRIKVHRKQKIFCIGLNKTGTTSVNAAWHELGIIVGDEYSAKKLFDPWREGNFNPIINYCKSAQAFQDSPFSFPETYKALDKAFPGSKFILTVRDDAEQWYSSITRFHAKMWGQGRIPTKADLMNAVNGYKGRPWLVNRALFGTPENDPYNKDILINFYAKYNLDVKTYFAGRSNDFLVLNLKDKNSYKTFCHFINEVPIGEDFPWKNKT